MSDTPRTDRVARLYDDLTNFPIVPAQFARELERELAGVRAENERLRDALNALLMACEDSGWPLTGDQEIPMQAAREALERKP